MPYRLLTALVLATLAGSAAADDTGIGVKVGTLGVGVDVSRPLSEQVNLRGSGSFLNLRRSVSESDVDYDARLKLKSVGALLDWHPGQGGLRFTAGAYLNKNTLDLDARPTAAGTLRLDGRTFSLQTELQSARARVTFRNIAPYLGIGWGNAALKTNAWSVVADLGVLYQHSPKVALTAVCVTPGSEVCGSITSAARTEEAELRDSLGEFRWYPVLSIGLAYRF